MARLFSIRPGITLRGRKFKGIRGWAGKPLHPPLTDIPVAAYFMVGVLDVLSYLGAEVFDWKDAPRNLFVASTYVLIFGGIVSIPTALTGFWDWLKSTPNHTQVWRTANWHMAIMLTVTVLVAINIFTRLGDFDDTSAVGLGLAIYSAVIALLVSLGATYGGSLVYDYAFNVEQGFDHAYTESEVDKLPGRDDAG